MVTSLIVVAALGLVFAVWRMLLHRAPTEAGHAGAVAWRGGRFRNVADTRAAGLRAVMREFWINRGIRRKPRTALPVTPVRADVLSGPASQALRVTWLGH